MATSNFLIPEIAANQSQKHVTVNEALAAIDSLLDKTVIATLSDPPIGVEQDKYIVGPSATGLWLGHEKKIAMFRDGNWAFAEPKEGWEVYDKFSNKVLRFTSDSLTGIWQSADVSTGPRMDLATSAGGAAIVMESREQTISLSGGAFESNINFPDGSIIFGVAARVTTAILGPAQILLGDAGNSARFGGPLSAALNSVSTSIHNVPVRSGALTVRITPVKFNFIGGALRLSIFYMVLTT